MTLSKKEKKLLELSRNLINENKALRGKAGIPSLTISDEIKKSACQFISKYKTENTLSNKDLANELSIPAHSISKILNFHINDFSLDFLVGCIDTLKKHHDKNQHNNETIKKIA